jgi:DNA-binding HxlR family transcriptional regulator
VKWRAEVLACLRHGPATLGELAQRLGTMPHVLHSPVKALYRQGLVDRDLETVYGPHPCQRHRYYLTKPT